MRSAFEFTQRILATTINREVDMAAPKVFDEFILNYFAAIITGDRTLDEQRDFVLEHTKVHKREELETYLPEISTVAIPTQS